MKLLDTDVMIDLLRAHLPAINWLRDLEDEPLGLPGFVAMELMKGCLNKREMEALNHDLEPFELYWPTTDDCNRAVKSFEKGYLSHNLGILDALIGECSVGLNTPICTFNVKHFRAMPNVQTEQPYVR